MSTPAGDDLVGDAEVRVDADTDPAMRALRQLSRDTQGRLRDIRGRFVAESNAINRQLSSNPPTLDVDTDPAMRALRQLSRDTQGRLRDIRGRFVAESNAINRQLSSNPPTLDVDTGPATGALDQFTRDAEGRLRDARGRFVRAGEDMSRSLTEAARGGDRFGDTLRSIARVAGRAAGAIGIFTGAVGALGAAAGPAAALLAGIATTLQQIAPASAVAVPALLSVAQAGAAIQLSMVGIEDAVTAAFDTSTKGAEEFTEALKRLSPNAREFALQIRQLVPDFQRFQQGVQNRVFAGLAGELQNLSEQVLPVLRTNINNTAVTLNEMALGASAAARELATSGTLGKAMEGANQGLSNLAAVPAQVVTALGQIAVAAAPAFDRLTSAAAAAATDISERIGEAFESGALTEPIDTALEVLRDLGDVAGNVFGIIGNVAAPFQEAGGSLVDTLLEITDALREATATEGFQEAMGAIAGVMSTLASTVGPLLGQALAAIGPVFTTLGPPVERLIQNLGEALSPIIEALGPVLEAAAGAIGELVDAVSPLLPVIGGLIASLLPALVPLLDAVKSIFIALAPSVAIFGQILSETLQPIFAQLPALVQPFADLISRLAHTVFPLLSDLLIQLAPSLTQIGVSFGELIAALAPLLETFSQLARDLLPVFVRLLTPIITLVGRLASVFAEQLASVVTNVLVPALQLVANLIRGDFSAAWNSLTELFSGVLRHIVNTVGGIREAVGAVVTGVIDFFVGLFNTLIGNSIVPDLINGIVRFFATLPGRALSAIASLAGDLAGRVREAGSRMLSALRTGLDSLLRVLRGLPGRALSAVGKLGTRLFGAGKDLIQGMIYGVRSVAGRLASAARGVVSGAIEGAKNLLGISSPSTVFAEIGQDTGLGFIRGFAGMQRRIEAAVQGVAESVPDSFAAPQMAPTSLRGLSSEGLGVGVLPTAAARSVAVNVNLNFTNDGVIGSRIELENWFARALDQIARTGRIPAALRTA